MSKPDDSNTVKIARGLVAGVVAGAIASFVMDRFQAVASPLLPSSGGEPSEPATEKAADGVVRRVTGRDVSDSYKPMAGQSVHYALGIALGAAYGVAAEFRPAVTAGYGAGFAFGTATLLDEGIVPAVGLGTVPWRADFATTVYSYASHLVFGGFAELVRRQVAGSLTK